GPTARNTLSGQRHVPTKDRVGGTTGLVEGLAKLRCPQPHAVRQDRLKESDVEGVREDGDRDGQAQPRSVQASAVREREAAARSDSGVRAFLGEARSHRSEERRVGKEWRGRGGRDE